MQHSDLVIPSLMRYAVGSIAVVTLSGMSLQALAQDKEVKDSEAKPAQTSLEAEFKKLDTNHDEKLSREEVANDKALADAFERADKNRDGVIVREEYGYFKGSSSPQKNLEAFLDDSTVTAKVKTALIKDVGLKGITISVQTYKGQVILSGFVDSEQQLQRAVEIASGISGVRSVKNSLVVKN